MIEKKDFIFKFTYFSLVFFWSTTIFEIGTSFFIKIFGISLSNIAFIFFLLSLLLHLYYNKIIIIIDWKFSKLILLIFLYIVFSFVGCLYSPMKYQGLKEITLLTYYFILFLFSLFLIKSLDEHYRIKMIFSIGLIGYSILILMTIFQFFNIIIFNDRSINFGIKYFSPFSDYNIFMFSFLIGVFILLLNYSRQKSYFFIFSINIFIIFLFSMLSGSRRSIIYLIFYLIILSKFLKSDSKKVFLFLMISLFTIIVFFIIFNNFSYNFSINIDKTAYSYINKVNRVINSLSGERKIYSERIERWIKAIEIIKNFDVIEYLVGMGTRSFYSFNEFIRPDGSFDHPHNFILISFIEGGFAKTFLILIIAIYPLTKIIKKKNFHQKKEYAILLLLYLIWIIQVSISGDEFFNSKQIFLIYFILYIYTDSNRKSNEKNCISCS